MKCFIEVNSYLRIYKEAFAAEEVMNVLGSVLADLCQKVMGFKRPEVKGQRSWRMFFCRSGRKEKMKM